MQNIEDSKQNSNTYFEGHRSKTVTPRIVIERRYTKNYVHDPQHGFGTVSIPPRDGGIRHKFDGRSDEKTGWRRISLECGGVS
jgi:hypothetical protein